MSGYAILLLPLFAFYYYIQLIITLALAFDSDFMSFRAVKTKADFLKCVLFRMPFVPLFYLFYFGFLRLIKTINSFFYYWKNLPDESDERV